MTEKGLIIAVTMNGNIVKYYRGWKYSEEEGCFDLVLTDKLTKANIFGDTVDGKTAAENNLDSIRIFYKDEFGAQIEEKVTVEVKEITLVV
jgi:hypothetical protein